MPQPNASAVAQRYAQDKKPPNLREAEDGLRSCATCSAFDLEAGACRSYNGYSVEPIQTCDSWHVVTDEAGM